MKWLMLVRGEAIMMICLKVRDGAYYFVSIESFIYKYGYKSHSTSLLVHLVICRLLQQTASSTVSH